MAAKDNNGLVISLSIFVLLSMGLGVAWYMTWSHSSDLQRQVAEMTSKEGELKTAITNLNSDIRSLKDLVGHPGDAVDEVVTGARQEIAKRAADGAVAENNLEGAVIKTSTDRDTLQVSANERLVQLNTKIAELSSLVVNHENAMKSLQAQVAQKEQELRDKERLHGEQLAQREKQIDETKAQLTATQEELVTLKQTTDREIEELNKEISGQRAALITLRRQKMALEGLTFERPDGKLTFVDQNALECYVDLGSRDELRVGTTFSVYSKSNSGVGRSQSDKDIKGKIEIVGILGDHLAEARIVDQKISSPLAEGDPVYSPLFWPGQKLKIAVVGMLDFDGNPGSDREEFQRIVRGAGAEIVLQVDDNSKILGKDGEELTLADIDKRITSDTRFLIVADLGDDTTVDTAQKEIYNRIRSYKQEMLEAAENNGVYVLSLSSFLDYIGYSSKRLVWTPTRDFPAVLPNGAKSLSPNAVIGRRASSAAISGAYAGRRRQPTVSNGATTKLYQSNDRGE